MMTKKTLKNKFVENYDSHSSNKPYRTDSAAVGEQDRLLWQKVASSVRPLSRKLRDIKSDNQGALMVAGVVALPQNSSLPISSLQSQGVAKTHHVGAVTDLRSPVTASLPVLSRKQQRRIARQYFDHTMRLDLHGLSQDRAYDLLLHFIHSNALRNQPVLLIITGKGRSMGSSGVLRQLVPQWLANVPFRAYISTVEEAARHHGGEGAFYVKLRRFSNLSKLEKT